MELKGTNSVFSFLIFVSLTQVASSQGPSRRCLDGIRHKPQPSSEPLSGACEDWSGDACCTNETSVNLGQNATWHNFNWEHCADKTLSPACRRHFQRDLCFYECSANVWPWIIPEPKQRRLRKERFIDIPLCQKDCEAWYKDCQNDYTCTQNWNDDFTWQNGTNVCPKDKSCKTFSEIYGSAKDMCEKIFGGSFKVTYDTEPCISLWFNASGTPKNPNRLVADWKGKILSSGQKWFPSAWTLVGVFAFVFRL